MPPLHLTPTGDGSLAVHSDEYGQAMHTLSGAREESLLKHIIPSRVLERDDHVLHVLDVGYGIGYNVLVLLEEFLKNRKGRCRNNIRELPGKKSLPGVWLRWGY